MNKFRLSLPVSSLILLIASSSVVQAQTDTVPRIHKSWPTGVLLRSAFVPGWGQFYNKKYIKAGIFAVGEGWLINEIYTNWRAADRYQSYFKSATDPTAKAAQFNQYTKYRDRRNVNMWILAATIFYSMFDAYVDAQLADFNQTDKAYEVYIAPTKDDGIQLVMTLNIP